MVKKFDTRHGSPHDRGDADAYYRRKFRPHYFKYPTEKREGTYEEITDLTEEERAAYTAGYEEAFEIGGKDWGEEE